MLNKRIALFLPNLAGGGAERILVTLGRELGSRGYAVDLVLVEASGPLMAEATDLNIVDLSANRASRALPKLARYLRALSPALLLSSLRHTNIIAVGARLLARTPTRIVVREANTASIAARHATRSRLILSLLRPAYRIADGVIAVSDGVAADLQQNLGVPARKITVIPNPTITQAVFDGMAEAVPSLDRARAQGALVVLAVGRLVPAKDFATLLRAFAILIRQQCNARLVILGEGPERQSLEALAAELAIDHSVAFPGFVSNPFKYMARADVFVLSSRYEGLPNVMIQAMACGCQIVSTDCPHGPREILLDGELGRLVPVGSVTELADAILSMRTRPVDTDRITERAADFLATTIVPQYVAYFESLLER